MKSEVAALEGILDFLLKSKPKKEKAVVKATKATKEKENKEEPEVKGKTVMMSMGHLGRKKATPKEETKETTFFKKKKRKR